MHGGSKTPIIMIVTLMPGIEAASGTLCKNRNGSRVIVTTRKAPSSNPNKVRMYIRSAASYQRTKLYSDAEIAAQKLFSRRQKYVRLLLDNGCPSRAEAWKIAKIVIR